MAKSKQPTSTEQPAKNAGADVVAPEKTSALKKSGARFRLAPGEWTGGDYLWLLALVGPEQTLPALKEKVIE